MKPEDIAAMAALAELLNNFSKCPCDMCSGPDTEEDAGNRPYYTAENGLTADYVISSFAMNFNLGCVVKYCVRCHKKGTAIEDLIKARTYIDKEIEWLKKNGFKEQ